jgi:tetratricopeptide (TPR) repeat protein
MSKLIGVRCDIIACVILALAAGEFLPCETANAGDRRLAVGKKVPEFSATDIAGRMFHYKPGEGKVLVAIFLSAGQKGSTRAAAEIEMILTKLDPNTEGLVVVVAVDDANGDPCFPPKQDWPTKDSHIFLDTEYRLWGKFGIIATPTVVIGGKDGKVLWVEAGHGYNFAPVVRARLNQALGIAQEISPEDAGRVKTVANTTVAARVKRHLQMSKILLEKGRFESAIAEVRKAKGLDPNSVEATLELGELLCRVNKAEAALSAIETIETTTKNQKARTLLISGWAKRQMGELDAAEKLLLDATTLDPKSGRVFFELGKVYQARGQLEKAVRAYYNALALVFGEPANTDFSHQQ